MGLEVQDNVVEEVVVVTQKSTRMRRHRRTRTRRTFFE